MFKVFILTKFLRPSRECVHGHIGVVAGCQEIRRTAALLYIILHTALEHEALGAILERCVLDSCCLELFNVAGTAAPEGPGDST